MTESSRTVPCGYFWWCVNCSSHNYSTDSTSSGGQNSLFFPVVHLPACIDDMRFFGSSHGRMCYSMRLFKGRVCTWLKSMPSVSMKHDNVKINHVNVQKTPHSAVPQFVICILFKRTNKKHWKDEIPATLFFRTLHGSPICQLHSKIVHKRACSPIKPPTPRRDPGEDNIQ